MNIRELALKTLFDITYNGAFSNIAVKNAMSGKNLSKQERDFFSRLVYGTSDKEITLDYYISALSKIKIKKISRYILVILRMGIYQIKFMDSVPDSAAVNESVRLAKRYGHKAAAGYVNGVLRSAAAKCIALPEDKTKYLSIKYAFPMGLCEKWINNFGYEFSENLMSEFEKPRDLTLRPNSLKITAEELCEKLNALGIKARDSEGCVFADGFDIADSELYKNGYFTVQDRAAMQPALLLSPLPDETVIDMCAAPGGKTTQMGELMENKGKILATDIYPHKVDLIKKNASRLGITIIDAREGNASMYDESLAETADKILCDVPCSGTGIIGRKPEIKKRKLPEDITETQKSILRVAAKYLKPNGVLVYSTCSIEKEENEDVTNCFINECHDFDKIYEKTFYPHIDHTDGFYMCKIRKER